MKNPVAPHLALQTWGKFPIRVPHLRSPAQGPAAGPCGTDPGRSQAHSSPCQQSPVFSALCGPQGRTPVSCVLNTGSGKMGAPPRSRDTCHSLSHHLVSIYYVGTSYRGTKMNKGPPLPSRDWQTSVCPVATSQLSGDTSPSC